MVPACPEKFPISGCPGRGPLRSPPGRRQYHHGHHPGSVRAQGVHATGHRGTGGHHVVEHHDRLPSAGRSRSTHPEPTPDVVEPPCRVQPHRVPAHATQPQAVVHHGVLPQTTRRPVCQPHQVRPTPRPNGGRSRRDRNHPEGSLVRELHALPTHRPDSTCQSVSQGPHQITSAVLLVGEYRPPRASPVTPERVDGRRLGEQAGADPPQPPELTVAVGAQHGPVTGAAGATERNGQFHEGPRGFARTETISHHTRQHPGERRRP